MKTFVLIVTVLFTFFTSILLNDSYLSLHQVNTSLLCKCNHSSHNEVHTTQTSLLLDEHSLLLSNQDSLPSCHSPKSMETTHICSCKKSSENLVHILFQKSMVIQSKIEVFALDFTNKFFICITSEKISLPSGFSFLITPPPKSII